MTADEDRHIKVAGDLADTALNALQHREVPSAEDIAFLIQAKQRFPEQLGKKIGDVEEHLAGAGFARDLLNGGDVSASRRLAEARALAASGGDLHAQRILRFAGKYVEAGAKSMADDAIAEGANRGWYRAVRPIDFSTPDTIARGVAEHGAAASALVSRQGGTQSAFTGQTLTEAKEMIASGSPDQRVHLLAAIVKLPPEVMKATLASIANDEEGKVFAVAGSVARYNPNAARDVLIGRAALQADKKLAPKDDATLADALAERVPPSDFPTEAREALRAAAISLYALSSQKANDVTGVLNETRLGQALTAVTGGVLDSRGAKVLAPFYGARQDDLDDLIRSLNDDDFAGARLADGSRFPAAALKPGAMSRLTYGNWRLQSFGEGTYLVVSGPRDNPRALIQGVSDTSGAGGGPFILDLASKRDRPGTPPPPYVPPLRPSWPAQPVDQP